MSRTARTITAVAALTLIGTAMSPEASGAAPTGSTGAAAAVPQLLVAVAGTDVGAPALSSTGRYVAYESIRRGQTPPRRRLVRLDVSNGNSELLNPSVDGGVARGNYSIPPVISADGSRVAFVSTGAKLVAGDTNGKNDAFVRDASTDTTLLVSRAFDGGFSSGASGSTSLSDDGRYAVFTSSGTDVVRGSTTTNSDVYRRDLSTGRTIQITVRPNGAPSKGPGSQAADVSADGDVVAFNSYDTDLAAADGNDGESDLFVRTVSTGTTRWVSPGLPAGANPFGVVLSPDGRWLSSRWDDGSLHLTRVDTATTTQVAASGYAPLGAFSAQQGRLVYVSGGRPFVRDLAGGGSTAVPVPSGAGVVSSVSISGDGRYAAYDWTPDDGSPSVIYRVAL